jgi:hypothetical protein
MKKPILLFGALLTALSFGACQSEIIADKAFTYLGVVSDSVTGELLDSVIVSTSDTLSGPTLATTDTLGEFDLTTFAPVTQLSFRRRGYNAKMVNTSANVTVDSLVVLLAK